MNNSYAKHGNKNRVSLFVTCMSSICVLLSLTACGQRGSLFIPTSPEAAQRSTIGDVLTQPASASPASTTAPTKNTTSPITTSPAAPAPAK